MKQRPFISESSVEIDLLLDRLLDRLPAKRATQWDQVFLRGERGFAGADADRSLALDPNRSLWLFGDTLIGSRSDPTNMKMPRNTIGILSHPDGVESGFQFFWREKNGRPFDFFPPVRAGEWLWPGTAAFINNQLYFFLNRFQTNSKRPIESLRFRPAGFYTCRVENYTDDPMQWDIQPVKVPPLPRSVFWSAACLADQDGYLYLWGRAIGHRAPGTVVARCSLSNFKSGCAGPWEYWGLIGNQPTWTQVTHHLQPIFPESATEMSLHYLKKHKIYITVYGPSSMNTVGIRIAQNIMGPWSRFEKIYTPPEAQWNPHYFCYAPKAHPELSNDENELLITYITNTHTLKELHADSRLYFAKFLSLRFNSL